MSLEEIKSNVELKELYANVLEAGENFDNLAQTFQQITENTKLRLKIRIESIRLNNQYESESTAAERATIDSWYNSATS